MYSYAPLAHSIQSVQSILIPSILFNQALAHGVDEVRIGRLLPARPHQARDLAAMIRRVQHHVGQNVFHGAGPWLALGVLVDDRLRKSGRRKLAEEITA